MLSYEMEEVVDRKVFLCAEGISLLSLRVEVESASVTKH